MNNEQLQQHNKKSNCIIFPCFDHEQVKVINKKIKENIFRDEPKSDVAYDTVKIGKFSQVPCTPLMDLLHPWLYKCQHANREVFGYDIHWHFHLDILNYNVYGTGGKYDWHIDSDTETTPIDMKLTCMLNLSEESYEGGEFYAIGQKKRTEFNSGGALVFNSLLPHKVTPVTKGERVTLTYWATGPPWR